MTAFIEHRTVVRSYLFTILMDHLVLSRIFSMGRTFFVRNNVFCMRLFLSAYFAGYADDSFFMQSDFLRSPLYWRDYFVHTKRVIYIQRIYSAYNQKHIDVLLENCIQKSMSQFAYKKSHLHTKKNTDFFSFEEFCTFRKRRLRALHRCINHQKVLGN